MGNFNDEMLFSLASKMTAVLYELDPYEYQDYDYSVEQAMEDLQQPYTVIENLLGIIDSLTE